MGIRLELCLFRIVLLSALQQWSSISILIEDTLERKLYTRNILLPHISFRMAASEGQFGEALVSVRAIVMAWDEKYGGWQPMDGGGISNVVLYQRPLLQAEPAAAEASVSWREAAPPPIYEFTIHGERLEDQRMTLHCELTADINYRQVMPTFHHWQIGERKFGLKFMTAYDASRFHDWLQKAVEQINQQSASQEESSGGKEEDEVFMPLELPMSRAESWESGQATPTAREVVSATVHAPPEWPPVPKKKSAVSATGVSFEASAGLAAGRAPTWPKTPQPGVSIKTRPYPQVHFHKDTAIAYSRTPEIRRSPSSAPGPSGYVTLAGQQPTRSVSLARPSGMEKRGSTTSLKVPLMYHHMPAMAAPPQGRRTKSSPGRAPTELLVLRPERCLYCRNAYFERENRRGSCPNAPDSCFQCIRQTSCLWGAECVLYRCCRHWTEGEGITEADMCSCSPDVPMRARRWTVLTLLTFCVPCLCLYPPLVACYRRCRQRGWVGGRHRPSSSTRSSGSGGRSSSIRVPTPEV